MEYTTEKTIALLEAINNNFSKIKENFNINISITEVKESDNKQEYIHCTLSRKNSFTDCMTLTINDHKLQYNNPSLYIEKDKAIHLNDNENNTIKKLCEEIEKKDKEYRENKREILFKEIVNIK